MAVCTAIVSIPIPMGDAFDVADHIDLIRDAYNRVGVDLPVGARLNLRNEPPPLVTTDGAVVDLDEVTLIAIDYETGQSGPVD